MKVECVWEFFVFFIVLFEVGFRLIFYNKKVVCLFKGRYRICLNGIIIGDNYGMNWGLVEIKRGLGYFYFLEFW